HRENSDQRGRASEASRGQGQTAAETPQYVITWYANPFESELRQEMGAVPHRIDRAFEDKAGCRTLHEYDRNTSFGWSIGIGAAEYRQNVRALAIPTRGRRDP